MATPRIYIGYNNSVTIQALDGGVAVDISAATKISVFLGTVEFDSENNPGVFDLTDLANGNVGLTYGAGMEKGVYAVRLVTFDAIHPDGLVWTHETDDPQTLVRVV